MLTKINTTGVKFGAGVVNVTAKLGDGDVRKRRNVFRPNLIKNYTNKFSSALHSILELGIHFAATIAGSD